jgi:hypothetical protein
VKKYIISRKLRMLHPRNNPADAPIATENENTHHAVLWNCLEKSSN